jgi:hypothetical protein
MTRISFVRLTEGGFTRITEEKKNADDADFFCLYYGGRIYADYLGVGMRLLRIIENNILH